MVSNEPKTESSPSPPSINEREESETEKMSIKWIVFNDIIRVWRFILILASAINYKLDLFNLSPLLLIQSKQGLFIFIFFFFELIWRRFHIISSPESNLEPSTSQKKKTCALHVVVLKPASRKEIGRTWRSSCSVEPGKTSVTSE